MSGLAVWAVACAAGLGVSACHNGKAGAGGGLGSRINAAFGRGQITLDGDTSDWPEKAATIADEDWVYFRVSVEGATAPIQAAPETLELWLDADNNGTTGKNMTEPADAAGMGVDLVVQYSPPDAEHAGQVSPGVRVMAMDAVQAPVELNHSAVGLASLPSYAAPQYEVRISRHLDGSASPALAKLMQERGRARGMFVLKDAGGKIVGWSDPETFSKPAAEKSMPLADMTVPAKRAGTIRVMSWNVLKSGIGQNPPPFARVVQVVQPDVIMFQEWDTDSATATAWFTAVVTGEHAWNARTGPDVVIVSPYAMEALGPETITAQGDEKPVRVVGAVVKTPAGDLAVADMHLKCCGTAGSPEDTLRLAQARAINEAMKSAMGQVSTPMRIVGGDLNLVGTPAPLGALAMGLDVNGGDLAVAQPRKLGDPVMTTWRDAKTPFPDGRLDYLLVGNAGAEVVDAFVFDASTLSAKSLAKMGMDRGDAEASDHLPVVVDLVARK